MSLPKNTKQSNLQHLLQEATTSYLAELEKHENSLSLRNVVKNFLTSRSNLVLLMETCDSRDGAKRIVQTLRTLREDQKHQQVLETFLSVENQTILNWQQLESILSDSKIFPHFKPLLVCEFSLEQEIEGNSVKLLSKIVDRLKVNPTKKIILVTAKKSLLNGPMKTLEKKMFIKYDEIKNNVTSEIYDDNNAALIGRAENGHVDDLVELIENGVDVNTTDSGGSTALHAAARGGQIRIIKILLENGANLIPNKDGYHPLHVAAMNGHVDAVFIFLDNNVYIDIAGNSGFTALHCAASLGLNDVVKTLVENGADVNANVNNELIPLYWAALIGSNDVVKILVENGADVNVKNNEGLTALHWAASNGHNGVVRTLLESGADVNIKDKFNRTALDLAQNKCNQQIVNLLREKMSEKLDT